MSDNIQKQLERRLGRIHARQRVGIETEHEQRVFGDGINFFHPENWYSAHTLIEAVLRATGMYWLGRRNALDIRVRENPVRIPALPRPFDGFRILHLTDLHLDLNPPVVSALIERIVRLDYDICVLTGDYRAQTYGPIEPALEAMAALLTQLSQPVYGVFGNHDSVRMLPGMEAIGVRMLLNESVELVRGDDMLHLIGIDDAHYYRVDSLAMAGQQVPDDGVSILLSHTPEIYRQAAHAGINLMLCGHTHGGQICLPGGIPITLDANCPRFMGAGAWRYREMHGYTSTGAGCSIVPVRFNCPPEVVIHRLRPV